MFGKGDEVFELFLRTPKLDPLAGTEGETGVKGPAFNDAEELAECNEWKDPPLTPPLSLVLLSELNEVWEDP
jgi:hypothetical protein